MNNKFLLAAVTSAIAAMAGLPAQADLKIGGFAQVEIATEKDSRPPAATSTFDGQTVEDNSRGRFTISADEDLGAGMKGIALYEVRVDTTGACELEASSGATCSNDLNAREKWVGLQTGAGTLKLGSVRSPYKYAGGTNWDAFLATNLEARGTGGMTAGAFGHNNFFDNGINYTSPTFGGVTIGATYVPDDVATPGVTTSSGDTSVAVEWKGGAFQVPVAYVRNNEASNDTEAFKVGLRFGVGGFAVMLQVEKVENESGSVEDDVAFLGLQQKFGPVTGVIQIGATNEGGTGTDSDITYAAIGAWYNFSKTFGAFTGYRNTTCERQVGAGALSSGACGAAVAGTTEREEEVFTFGLRKTF